MKYPAKIVSYFYIKVEEILVDEDDISLKNWVDKDITVFSGRDWKG